MTSRGPHIAILSPYVPYAGIDHAGGEYLRRYCAALVDLGWRVSLLASRTQVNLEVARRSVPGVGIVIADTKPVPGLLRRASGVPRPFGPDLPAAFADVIRSADVVDLQWWETMSYASEVRAVAPRSHINLTMHDVMSQRLLSNLHGSSSRRDRLISLVRLPNVWLRERSVGRIADSVTVFKMADGVELGLADRPDKLVLAPLCVDLPPHPYGPAATSQRILFVGAFHRPENEEAALWFVEEVWPLVLQAQPKATLRLAGASPTSRMLHLASDTIEITGYLTDLNEAYADVLAVVAPMRWGAGLKFKVVQAMALGFPTFGTGLALAGLEDYVGALRPNGADSPEALAGQLIGCLREPTTAIADAAVRARALEPHLDFSAAIAAISARFSGAPPPANPGSPVQ